MSGSDQPWIPLSIMLSMYGSRITSKLLFRYPYNKSQSDTQPLSSYKQLTSSTFHLNRQHGSVSDDSDDVKKAPRNEAEQLDSFSDELLATILSPGNTKICGKKFDLKTNGIRFVGFPLVIDQFSSVLSKFDILEKYRQHNKEHEGCKKKEDSTLLSFNIVFVLKAVAEYTIVEKYQELALQLGLALRFEEKCSDYLTHETRLMLSVHDEMSLESECMAEPEHAYKTILEKSHLADQLHIIFNSICQTGILSVKVNNSTHISFCLPHKVHNMASYGQNTISVSFIEKAIEKIRPYHGILIFDKKEIWSTLPDDYTPSLTRLLTVYEPTKSLQCTASDADLPLTQIYTLTSQLVYWGKACIIYPLCDSNIYVIAPSAELNPNSEAARSFYMRFNHDMVDVLSNFSLPVRLSDFQTPHGLFYGEEDKLAQVVFWLLQHRFLIQMHTFIYFCPVEADQQSTMSEQKPPIQNIETRSIIAGLPWKQRKAIMDVHASNSAKDLRLFINLLKYFDGNCHMEEIMYNENLSRTQLLALLDKFSPVLLTTSREDSTTAAFCMGLI
uniref:GATOR complex protein NPRL3-like n=1 Tax=Styela clava TaxID=7725 RepID=UPI0019399CCE|nr:GATOR complex protein NPRL3-like [Styela clava]